MCFQRARGADRRTHRAGSSRRLGDQAGLGFLEEGDDVLALDARKAIEEVVDRLAALEVVEQRLHGTDPERQNQEEEPGSVPNKIDSDRVFAYPRLWYSLQVRSMPSCSGMLGCQPRAARRATSSSLRGVPSGFERSHSIAASAPVARRTISASSAMLRSSPPPMLTSGGWRLLNSAPSL